MKGFLYRSTAALTVLLTCFSTAAAAEMTGGCAGPTRFDPIVGNSTLFGAPNMSDSAWHDDTWAFRAFGALSRLTLYKAWFYDGEWHNPGEFKGIQAWYGRYYRTDETRLLFGAKRPHFPLNCTLYRPEYFVRAELQWDHVMRFMNFSTNLGRYCAWGFPDVDNVTKAVVEPPAPNTYIAALRGYEGKPLPPSLGGHKKRYIVQLGFAWAQLSCNQTSQGQAAANNSTITATASTAAAAGATATAAAAAATATALAAPAIAAPAAIIGPAAPQPGPAAVANNGVAANVSAGLNATAALSAAPAALPLAPSLQQSNNGLNVSQPATVNTTSPNAMHPVQVAAASEGLSLATADAAPTPLPGNGSSHLLQPALAVPLGGQKPTTASHNTTGANTTPANSSDAVPPGAASLPVVAP